jgi:site-specific recombinase XerD
MAYGTTSRRGFQGAFREHLVASGKSSHTVTAYTRDVRLFGEWFDRTSGKGLAPGRGGVRALLRLRLRSALRTTPRL